MKMGDLRFRYFALNTDMRWRALRYLHYQHPHDAQLSVEELRGIVIREGEAFSNCVLHYATSLRGTRQYWFKQQSQTHGYTRSAHSLLHSLTTTYSGRLATEARLSQ